MKQNDQVDMIKTLGNQSLFKYEAKDGLWDIFAGFSLMMCCLMAFLFHYDDWILVPFYLGLLMPILLIRIRKKIIIPRIGIANFSPKVLSFNRNMLSFLVMISVIIFYISDIPNRLNPNWNSSAWAALVLTIYIIAFYGRKVSMYFVIAFTLVPLLYPVYRARYHEILIFTLIMSALSLVFGKLGKANFWKDVTSIPKPKNIIQIILLFVVAVLVEYFLFFIFNLDIAILLKKTMLQNIGFTLSIYFALVIGIFGFAYKLARTFVYVSLVICASSLTYVFSGTQSVLLILLIIIGHVVCISGIYMLVKYLHENPVLEVADER